MVTASLGEALAKLLDERLSRIGAVLSTSGGDASLEVPPANLREAAHLLKADPGCAFDFLACLTGVDLHPREPGYEVVCHLRSLIRGHRMVLRTRVPESAPQVPSLVPVWPAADWFEREAFDLLGLVFTGHPDLRRILMPPDWRGHPLRKDYPLEGPTAGEDA